MELDSSTSASWADFDPALGEILLTSTQIQEKIAKLGDVIAKDYRNRSLLMVGVLKGALFFIATQPTP